MYEFIIIKNIHQEKISEKSSHLNLTSSKPNSTKIILFWKKHGIFFEKVKLEKYSLQSIKFFWHFSEGTKETIKNRWIYDFAAITPAFHLTSSQNKYQLVTPESIKKNKSYIFVEIYNTHTHTHIYIQFHYWKPLMPFRQHSGWSEICIYENE